MRTVLFVVASLAASFAMASPENDARQKVEEAAADYKLCVMVWSSRLYDPETFPVEIVREAADKCIDETISYLQAAPNDGYRMYQIAFYEALQEVIHLRLTELR